MKHYLSRLSARIRAICILLALFLVPDIVQAEDVYLLTAENINGTTSNYNVPSKHQFSNSSGSVYTYTITSMPATGFSFRIGVQGWDKDMQPYTDGDALPINGDSYSITTDCYGKDKAWKVSYTKGEYNSLTITVDLSTSKRYVKITGVKSSTGGGSSTSGDESADNSDTESTTAGYGVPDNFGGVILRYNSSTEPTKGNLYDWKDYFSVAYLTPDSKGFKSTFAPYFSNLIKDVSSHSEKEDGWDGYVVSMSQSSHPLSLTAYGNPKFLIGNWSNSTSWSVGSELNYTKPYLEKINSSYAGMLDFPLHTFIYNIEQGKYSDESVKGWQALTYLSQIAPTNNNRSSVVGSGRSNDGIYNRLGVTFVNNDKVNNISGVENIKKAYAVILTSPGTPVVNYTDLTNNDLNDNILRLIKIRQWAGVKNTSSFDTSEDKNYNNAYDYHIKGDFADLKVVVGDEAYVANYEKNGNNGSTSGGTDDRNNAKFGGDGYNYTLLDEGTGWRVWYRNNNNTDAIHVAISPEGGLKTGTVNCTGQVIGIAGSGERMFAYTTDGTAPVLGASNTKTVTYTWNSTTQSGKIDDFSSTHSTVVANGGYVTVIAQAIKDGALTGAIDTVTYRFNDYVPLNVRLTPTTATVNYGASLTPKVSVVGTTADKDTYYAFTIDGSKPTIDAAKGTGTGSTVVKKYDYDPVVPTNDIYTFYMSTADTLTYIDFDGKEHTLDGNTVTVKAQAVKAVTSDGTTTYSLEGDIATGTYVFKTAGIKPTAGSYTISVTNENQTDKPSINKVTATVTVKNEKGEDDGVDVYYTIDGSDPAKVGNAGARLVKGRKIEVYGIVNLKHGAENRIRVAIAGSKPLEGDDIDDGTTHASCKFDLTCSTSEGKYKTYRENKTDQNLKTYGGDGHIVVYILPWSSKYVSQQETSGYIWVQNALEGYRSYEDLTENSNESRVAGLRVPFIYAYENFVNNDGVVESKALTHATHTIDVFTDMAVGLPIPNQENQENQEEQEEQETYPPYCWYYVDLVPDDNYKEVNVEVGYYDLVTGKWEFTPATIANVHNDMFLKFDVATGQIEDVTYEYTKDHFYTTGENGTKSEPANPANGEHFFYAQVPEAWTINDNSVKVFQNDTELSDYTVKVQGSAETSCLSKVCKISVPDLGKDTILTIQPYHVDKASGLKWTINYVNGGYYFYESATHYTTNAPLVFSADADGVVEDQRPYGHRDVNHTLETTPGARVKKEGCFAYGDFTYYLTPHWKDESNNEVPTTTVTDNWNGESATVNTIAAGTTISQTVDLHTAGQGFYTVQMIVRGTKDAKATLQLEGSDFNGEEESVGDEEGDDDSGEGSEPTVKASASVSKTFAGYNAQGTVTTDGRVEHLLKTDTKNGWQKLETVASVGEEGTLTISLTAEGGELQLSDVTLLCNANTPPEPIKGYNGNIISYYYYPTIWTKAPTNSDVTEYDLTDRHGANEFSFFDRGDNRNAVIYADKNTVLGMSENTYNVAVPTGYKSDNTEESYAKHRPVFRAEGHDVKTGLPFKIATGHTLVFYDKPEDWDNEHTWGTSAQQITWDNFSWDRNFYSTREGSGERNTIFLPFTMNENQIKTIFDTDAKVYSITSVDTKNLTVTGTPVTQTDPNTGEQVTGTAPNVPYIVELREPKNGVSYDDTSDKLVTYYSKYDSQSSGISGQGQFVGVYKYTKFNTKSDDSYDYYCYGAERNGIFDHFSDEGADIKPFRAYLRINRSAGSKPFYYFIVNDNETTGIEGVNASTLNEDAPVYNLQGQVIRQAGQHAPLPKGLYIQNGRKFVQQ